NSDSSTVTMIDEAIATTTATTAKQTTTTTKATTTKATTKKADAPKTGVAGVGVPAAVLVLAFGAAFAVRRKKNED
ncbi:MAG: NPXTG-anchored protein, partial [Ruminococcus sp.]|nr:NPXTG-anchored protein [Ruminococcus sp.]